MVTQISSVIVGPMVFGFYPSSSGLLGSIAIVALMFIPYILTKRKLIIAKKRLENSKSE